VTVSNSPIEADAALSDDVRESETARLADDIVLAVQEVIAKQRRPRATYRVQFNTDFTFQRAAELVPYWKAIGISDVYASPYLKAVPGSRHGYDIVDHSTLNPDVGNTEDYRKFTSTLDAHGMGHILDWVPNHMGVGSDDNAWWRDVLENGPGSRHSSYFDIDWNPPKTDLQGKVLLPVLGQQFGQVLENGQLRLEFQNGSFFIRYYSRRFPIAPPSFGRILQHRLEELSAALLSDETNLFEYQSILTAVSHLPPLTEIDRQKLEERYREQEIIKRRLKRVCEECPPIRDHIFQNVEAFNGRVGDPASFDLLDKLLDEQSYRLSFWRVASDEINYRRFFDVNELAAVCMERPEVFEDAHAFVFELLNQGLVDGLRIDHADGLYDPTAYLWQLQERRFLQLCRSEFDQRFPPIVEQSEPAPQQPGAESTVAAISSSNPPWSEVEVVLRGRFMSQRETDANAPVLRPLYLLVEKILERDERLPQTWPVHGSTGYDFINDLNGLFVDGTNSLKFDTLYSKFIDRKLNYHEMVYEAKRLILRASMSSELHVLGHSLDRISERNRWTRDFTLHGLIQALREVIACFPVYRTYTVGSGILERDQRYVQKAIAQAKRRNHDISTDIFDFVREVLLLQKVDTLTEGELRQRQAFVGRFQQLTGPMMATAVEVTTYYRYNRLVSLNEVGGDPQRFGVSVGEFHLLNLERQARQPYAMLATSTHDTKRSEDVRARINTLSELPDEWKKRITRWSKSNTRKKVNLDGDLVPSKNDEYLLYQTLLGTWPLKSPRAEELATYISRIQQYMIKAVREAKLYTSWIAPNEPYERGITTFVEEILRDEPGNAFRSDFEPFAQLISECGLWNSLAQTLLKLTSPGIPDIYQGSGLWDFSLVDPDNRRPIDYDKRSQQLNEVIASVQSSHESLFATELLSSAHDGRIKLLVHLQALDFRRRHPEVFTTGEYLPVTTTGTHAAHVCAFVRRSGSTAALIVVPRLIVQLSNPSGAAPIGSAIWDDTQIVLPANVARRSWKNLFTSDNVVALENATIPVSQVLQQFPVGLLEAASPDTGP
jgi:(1->4)-alpha-D-glucan 1-alpha-D-glucosylmutase